MVVDISAWWWRHWLVGRGKMVAFVGEKKETWISQFQMNGGDPFSYF
jgi:hypothetical protein